MLRGACLLHVFTRCEPGTTVADVRIWLLGQLYESQETANKSLKHTPLFEKKKKKRNTRLSGPNIIQFVELAGKMVSKRATWQQRTAHVYSELCSLHYFFMN